MYIDGFIETQCEEALKPTYVFVYVVNITTLFSNRYEEFVQTFTAVGVRLFSK
jgi:hypothetical protein